MEGALGQDPTGVKRASSKPSSIQLPSPPASPPFQPQNRPPLTLPRSQSHTHGHVRSQSLLASSADWGFHAPRASRPPLTSTASAPSTALPFRPISNASSPPAPPSAWPQTTGVPLPHSPPRSPPVPSTFSVPPLTTAFVTPRQRSGSQSTHATSDFARFPSVTTSPAPPPVPMSATVAELGSLPSSTPSRARSISVMSDGRPGRVPQGARPKPVSMHRIENTSGSSETWSSAELSQRTSVSATPATDGHGAEASRRSILRNYSSMHTPQVEQTRTPEGQSVVPSYCDARHHTATSSNSPRTPRSAPPSAILTSSLNPSPIEGSISTAPSAYSRASSSSKRSTAPHGKSSSRAVPALVKRKDSSALKPIPVSSLMQSPPTSPSVALGRGASVSAAPTAYAPTTRSRSGSIASPSASREASISRDRLVSRPPSIRPQHPVVEILPPMEFTPPPDFSDDENYP